MTKKVNQTAEIASLILIAQAAKKTIPVPAVKVERAKPEEVDKSLHALAVKMVHAEGAHDKALNGVYTTFKLYSLAALPIIARMPAHEAALRDIKATYGAVRIAAAIQRITMLNNMRKIAYGAIATRDTPAQAAQGLDCVREALEVCTSLPALKVALGVMKMVKHAATGAAKITASGAKAKAKAKAKANAAKNAPVPDAGNTPMPSTRQDAIAAGCRMLEFISMTFLQAGTDADLIHEVADVVAHLQAKAA